MPFDPDAYTRRILAARRRHLALDARMLAQLDAILRAHADELARAIANLPATATEAQRQAVVHRITERLHQRLELQLRRITEDGIRLQFSEIKAEMDRATLEAIRSEGMAAARVGFQPRPLANAAAAYIARGQVAQEFRTLALHVRDAGDAVDELIAEALAQQWSPEDLARRLRPFVQGNPGFTDEELLDLRRVPRDRLQEAKQLRYNARRIALTEMGNAAHEAQTQAMIDAPMVELSRWRLSPVRGTQTEPDECDWLSARDVYGHGAGLYPVIVIPVRPHPHDRCWLQSVTRPPSEWTAPKPGGEVVLWPDATDEIFQTLTINAAMRAARSARRAIEAGREAAREREGAGAGAGGAV